MNILNLEKIFANKPAFQLRQAKEAVFKNLISDWNEATNLPKELREALNKECPLKIDAELFFSDDKKTIKALVTLEDGLKIETVLMRYETLRQAQGINFRNTVCVSSQVGCPLGCLFCATGKAGFKRNLKTDEIVEQVLLFARYLKKQSGHSEAEGQRISDFMSATKSRIRGRSLASLGMTKNDQRVDNVVFMGMGEPFLNYENVVAAIKILNDQKYGLSIGARHISISTVGITEGIEKLANEPIQANLAISLHAPNNELRSKIVPMNKKYPIEKVFQAVENYLKKTGRKVMFEYIMIKEINDAPEQAKELAALVKKVKNGPCMVNLISYNVASHSDAKGRRISHECGNITPHTREILHYVRDDNSFNNFVPSPPETIKTFKDILMKAGVNATQRFKFGQDIKAACGQLAGKNR